MPAGAASPDATLAAPAPGSAPAPTPDAYASTSPTSTRAISVTPQPAMGAPPFERPHNDAAAPAVQRAVTAPTSPMLNGQPHVSVRLGHVEPGAHPVRTAKAVRLGNDATRDGGVRGDGGDKFSRSPAAFLSMDMDRLRTLPTAEETCAQLSIENVRAQLGQAVAEALWPIFDINNTMECTRYEFTRAFELVWDEWSSLRTSLEGHRSVSSALRVLADCLLYLISFILFLLFMEIDVLQAFIAIGTLLVPTSFVLQGGFSNAVTGILFIIGNRTYRAAECTCAHAWRGRVQ
ncbi:hypothetical protein EON66_08625 [archaeon]|nr:MAG: hypothetical protein EON66_08625 [archaeon]